MKILLGILAVGALAGGGVAYYFGVSPLPLISSALAGTSAPEGEAAFFRQYCMDCHSGEKTKGDFDFGPLLKADGFQNHAPEWLDALDLVEDESMPPPEDEGEIPFPSHQERQLAMKWARHHLAEASGTAGRLARRLNRTMYNNTVRDLLLIDAEPANRFPQDLGLHGFNNAVETQTVSPFLLERYLEAATECLDMAIVDGDEPERFHYYFFPLGKDHKSKGKLVSAEVDLTAVRNKRDHQYKPEEIHRVMGLDYRSFAHGGNGRVREGKGRHGYEAALHHTGTLQHRGKISVNAPYLGARYRLTVHAYAERAVDRDGKPVPPAGACLMGFEVNGVLHSEVEVPLGDTPRPYTIELTTDRNKTQFSFVAASPLEKRQAGQVPYLVVTEAELEGPIYDAWPPASHRAVLGDGSVPPEAALRRFITRAFRRPATDEDVAKYLAIYEGEKEAGENHTEAMKTAAKAVMVSPNFLFLREERREDRSLSDWELATRLSYFLWASMPDEELFDLAETGELSRPKVLQAQVRRMLRDDKAESFVQSFGGQWIGFHRLAEVAPDPTVFPHWDEELRQAMLGEMEHSFRHVMREDRSVLEFLDADYTFANDRLRRHYGWPESGEPGYERVALTPDEVRGGLLTQAGVLTVASQPTRSSPVFRGVFVVERLFNRPPPNPPAQVPELEAAAEEGEATTVKAQLERHVADPNCASCHAKIDPWGLPLESFNGIGQWREQTVEEVSATLPGGAEIAGPLGLKRALMDDPDRFVQGLAEKLMMYGLGRTLDYPAEQEIDGIVAEARKADYRFHSLVEAVVMSDSFRKF